MEAQLSESGELLFEADREEGVDELVIIFDGHIELYTVMDNGTEFTIEHLSKGSVINAHSFLVRRQMPISARFSLNTTYYTLSAEKFGDIASEYIESGGLLEVYNVVLSAALAAKER